jgi:hypothetical protein
VIHCRRHAIRRHFAIAAAAIRRRRHFADAAFTDSSTLIIFRLFHIDTPLFSAISPLSLSSPPRRAAVCHADISALQAAAAAELTFSLMPYFIAATDIFDIFTPLFFLFIFSLVIFAFIYD